MSKTYHFIGIKGSGMSALALMLHQMGHTVQGSDVSKYYFTQRGLEQAGIKILPFSEDNITEDVELIAGNAFREDNNVEIAYAMKNGFDYVATGHYCSNQEIDGFMYLTKAADQNKDQTYFLCQINERALKKTLFPLGTLTKPEVREIAQKLHLDSVSSKKDSTGICFIGERNFRQFLSNYLPSQEGDIVDIDTGKKIARHVGVLYYTIGQRKGLNIDHEKGPWFVCGKDVKKNILFVCRVDHKEWLYSNSCLVKGINWLVPDPDQIATSLGCKFRYRQPDQPVQIQLVSKDSVLVTYPQKIASVTVGQEAVFYDHQICLGGGVIEEVYIDDEDLNSKILKTYQEKQFGND